MLAGAITDPNNPPYTTYANIILGGTGRFVGTTGYISMYGITDMILGTWSLIGEGEVTY